MNATQQIPVVSPDAGDPVALQDPSSPASIMKRAKSMEAQTAADTQYDATPPPRLEGFQDCRTDSHEITHGLLIATSVLLLLYAVAPD